MNFWRQTASLTGAFVGAPMTLYGALKCQSSLVMGISIVWCFTELFFLDKPKTTDLRLFLGLTGIIGAFTILHHAEKCESKILTLTGYGLLFVELCFLFINSV